MLMKRSESLLRSGLNAASFQPRVSILRDGAAIALRSSSLRTSLSLIAATGALGLAGCAQQPQTMHGKEYFPSSVYGQASPRVIADGQEIPRGGGVYKTGSTYTVAGHTYYPMEGNHYSGVGMASWYGDAFHGRRTANGEIYDRNSISAAHPTMPLPSYARVTNLRNHYSIIVRVNDRGPFAPGRIMDVSRRVADLLDFRRTGTTRVKVDFVGQASLAGSDDGKLAATLRQDGQMARLDMHHPPTFVAETDPIQTALAASSETPPFPTDPVVRDTPASGTNAAGTSATDTSPTATTASDAGDAPVAAEAVFKGKLPLPPARPFDLDTIPGAGAEISAR
jgi:rare lipoprotein A